MAAAPQVAALAQAASAGTAAPQARALAHGVSWRHSPAVGASHEASHRGTSFDLAVGSSPGVEARRNANDPRTASTRTAAMPAAAIVVVHGRRGFPAANASGAAGSPARLTAQVVGNEPVDRVAVAAHELVEDPVVAGDETGRQVLVGGPMPRGVGTIRRSITRSH